jgi:iron complex transport system substrate-binding protein
MTKPRIVSFLPAATEMVFALGAGDQLVGISHECDFPPEAKGKPVVVRPALDLQSMTLREIDVAVAEQIRSGASLYTVDEELLCALKPDLILTQNLCQVCAPSGNDLASALKLLHPAPQILWMSPHSLAEIFENIIELGQSLGLASEADACVEDCRRRLAQVAAKTAQASTRPRAFCPRVFCMEWADPVYCAGHWVPEMVELAGGRDELARRGTDSVRMAWADVVAWAPEIVVFAPCGFNLEKALEQVQYLERLPGWADLPAVRNHRSYVVDANSYFARPGPRVVEGTELLAHLIHSELFDWNGPADAFQAVSTSNTIPSKTSIKVCPECGQSFECKSGGCWCSDLPPLPRGTLPASDCLCPACLANAVKLNATLR